MEAKLGDANELEWRSHAWRQARTPAQRQAAIAGSLQWPAGFCWKNGHNTIERRRKAPLNAPQISEVILCPTKLGDQR